MKTSLERYLSVLAVVMVVSFFTLIGMFIIHA